MAEDGFEIWSGARGVFVVDNAVRRGILRALSEGPRSLTELVQLSGKAKSTLSAIHMPELVSAGLVVEKRHPDDSRIVLFELVGRPVTSSEKGEVHLERSMAKERDQIRGDEFRSPWALVEPKALAGLSNAAAVRTHLATQVARRWSILLRETRLPAFLREVGDHLERAGIARIPAVSPLGHYFRLEGLDAAEAPFFRDVLEALVADKAGLRVRVSIEEDGRLFRLEPAG